MFEEDQFDRFCRIVLAWIIFAERTIEIEFWHLWRRSLIKAQSVVKRLWITLYHRLISPALMFVGLKRIPSWTELEENVKRLEAQTGRPFPRTAAHIEGLKHEQAKKESE
jgi:hypothetical protein